MSQHEDRYRIISSLIWDYAYSFDVDQDGNLVNNWITEESFERLTGYSWAEVGTSFVLYHPEDLQRAQADVKNTLQGIRSDGEYRIFTKHGELRWLNIQRYPVWDEQEQRVIRFYAVGQDITERKRAEEALRQSEERARNLQDKLRILSEVTIELSATASLEDLYRQAIVLGRERLGFDRLGLLLIDEVRQRIECTFGTDLEGNLRDERHLSIPIQEDLRVMEVIRAHERVRVWQDVELADEWKSVGTGWSAMAVLWDGDKGIGWLATDNFIRHEPIEPHMTEILVLYGNVLGHLVTRKQAEAALQDSLEHLESIVEERTYQLRRAKEQTDALVNNVLHDLSNPITALATHLYLLKRNPERLHEQVGIFETQIRHLRDLVADLRSLSELDTGRISVSLTPVDLNTLVQTMLDIYLPLAQNKRQHLSFQSSNLPLLPLDAKQTQRVIGNLISNAINYTPENREIRLVTYFELGQVVLEIQDEGIGIEAEALDRIFERFFRTDTARNTYYSGTGLGLSIARELVQAQGGSISVSSQRGIGSTFTIRFPLQTS